MLGRTLLGSARRLGPCSSFQRLHTLVKPTTVKAHRRVSQSFASARPATMAATQTQPLESQYPERYGSFKRSAGPVSLQESYNQPHTVTKWTSEKTGLRVVLIDVEGKRSAPQVSCHIIAAYSNQSYIIPSFTRCNVPLITVRSAVQSVRFGGNRDLRRLRLSAHIGAVSLDNTLSLARKAPY